MGLIRQPLMTFAILSQELNRRKFLNAAEEASLSTLRVHVPKDSSPNSGGAAPVVDTHVHRFAGKDDLRFPHHLRAPYRPETAASLKFFC